MIVQLAIQTSRHSTVHAFITRKNLTGIDITLKRYSGRKLPLQGKSKYYSENAIQNIINDGLLAAA